MRLVVGTFVLKKRRKLSTCQRSSNIYFIFADFSSSLQIDHMNLRDFFLLPNVSNLRIFAQIVSGCDLINIRAMFAFCALISQASKRDIPYFLFARMLSIFLHLYQST